MSSDAGIQRLLMLADFLETVPEKKFDINVWRRDKNSWDISDGNLITECGTVACAVGWACALPEFQKMGLWYDLYPIYQIPGTEMKYEAWDAIQQFFDLDLGQSLYLFHSSAYGKVYGTRENVVSRIREYCVGKIS